MKTRWDEDGDSQCNMRTGRGQEKTRTGRGPGEGEDSKRLV